MQITVDHAELSSALEGLKRTIGKPTLPASTCIHMDADKNTGTIRLHSSDGAFHTLMSIPAKSISHSGEALVDASLFSGLVKTYDSDINIEATVNNGITMKYKRNQSHIPGLDPNMRITEPITGTSAQWTIDYKDFSATVSAIDYARLKKNGNAVYQDYGLKIENGEAVFLAADGHRVAMAKLAAAGIPDADIMVPAKALSDVIALGSEAHPVTVEFFANIIKFDMGDTTYYAPYVTTKFPPFEKHIARRGNCFAVDRGELIKALTRAELVTARSDGKSTDVLPGIIEVSITTSALFISGSGGGGIIAEELDVINPNGIDDTVKLYARFLLDAVKRSTAENVEIDLDSGARRPVLVFADGLDTMGHLIMPMKADNPPPPMPTQTEEEPSDEQAAEPRDSE